MPGFERVRPILLIFAARRAITLLCLPDDLLDFLNVKVVQGTGVFIVVNWRGVRT